MTNVKWLSPAESFHGLLPRNAVPFKMTRVSSLSRAVLRIASEGLMAEANDETVDPAEAKTIVAMWEDVAVAVPRKQGVAQATALGMNFRIDVLKAIQATWQAVHVYAKLHAPFDLWSVSGIAVSTLNAARTLIAAVAEEMRPIDYVTYVVLSKTPEGVPSGVLEKQVAELVAEPTSVYFARYLGMTPSLIARAAEVVQTPEWFEGVLGSLEERQMAERRGELVLPKSRSFTIEWTG